jgi:hypothetical protein
MTVGEQVKGVRIKIFCLNKIISRLEEPDTHSQFIVDYGLYPTPANHRKECSNTVFFIHSFIHSFNHSSMALQPLVGSWLLFQFHNPILSIGRTPWTGDQPITRPLSAHRTAQTEQMYTVIRASSGIRTHDPTVRVGEDCSCPRLCGHCNRQ